ncbi:hypothetical protein CEXT_701151 [Caerostris extrusa]|uniref:Uncharacterized protein n=1 Tax=Caerostris extrusa TaxID=172846 RepID=A0AAV4NUK8_CAEEX|nr:hypothetical protein CEXT_701151 [Caerostris extrusa]
MLWSQSFRKLNLFAIHSLQNAFPFENPQHKTFFTLSSQTLSVRTPRFQTKRPLRLQSPSDCQSFCPKTLHFAKYRSFCRDSIVCRTLWTFVLQTFIS